MNRKTAVLHHRFWPVVLLASSVSEACSKFDALANLATEIPVVVTEHEPWERAIEQRIAQANEARVTEHADDSPK